MRAMWRAALSPQIGWGQATTRGKRCCQLPAGRAVRVRREQLQDAFSVIDDADEKTQQCCSCCTNNHSAGKIQRPWRAIAESLHAPHWFPTLTPPQELSCSSSRSSVTTRTDQWHLRDNWKNSHFPTLVFFFLRYHHKSRVQTPT